MLQGADTDLINPLSLKLTIASVKVYYFLYKLSQYKSVTAKAYTSKLEVYILKKYF